MARSPTRRRPAGYSRDYRDDRNRRRRSRSRERHYDSRDYSRHDGRHDRARDRDYYGDRRQERQSDDYYPNSRDRSRSPGRRHSRERRVSPMREERHRSPDTRHREDDVYEPRDRKRKREPSGGNHATHRPTTRDAETESSNAATIEKEDEQAKQAAKRAKVEAWKKNMLESKVGNGKATSPTASSPPTSQPVTAEGSPAPIVQDGQDMAPRAKFDPRLIKKRAAERMAQNVEKQTLGGDAIIPTSATTVQNTNRPTAIDRQMAPARGASAKITGFDLNKPSADKSGENAIASKPAAALEDEEDDQRKIRKLPDPSLDEATVQDLSPAADEDFDENDADDLRSDEEEAEAAREKAQRRAAEAQSKQNDSVANDAAVLDPQQETPSHTQSHEKMEVDDEEDDWFNAVIGHYKQLEESENSLVTAGHGRNRLNQPFQEEVDTADFEPVGDNAEDLLNHPKRKKKDIPTVDHAKMDYAEFRKNFYSEPAEIATMSEEEVAKLRVELDDMTARGVDPPRPITKWAHCGFTSQVVDVLRAQNFEAPTAIQCQALPSIMSGRDTIGIAKTGSGKTLAFVLPMFRHIQDQPRVQNLEGPIGLVVAPTRELAVQIHAECKPYLKALGLRGVCAYGGAPIKDQIAEVKRGAEVLVGTPGRLIDLLAANAGRVTNLRRVTYIVIDEADRMFDMGFEPQITRILNNIRPNRQTVLFSATFPHKMEALARKILANPVQIVTGNRTKVAPEITQVVEVREEDTKFNRCLGLLGELFKNDDDVRCLIFVEKQETADELFKKLNAKGYTNHIMHGGQEQIDRDDSIADFKAGHVKVLVATSVAARGLDVKQLNLVINYDSPNHGEDYVHRAGRTGRAGNTGTAVTFVTPQQDRFAPFLLRALKDSQQKVPDELEALAKTHKDKVKAGEAQKASSGFGGKGIERFEAARAADRAREKKQFKTGDEPDEEDESKDKATDGKLSEIDKLIAKAGTATRGRDEEPEAPAVPAMPENLAEHLRNALTVHKVEVNPATKPNDPLARVNAAAASINNRFGNRGSTSSSRAVDNRGPDAGAFHSILRINDFPQRARWAVTNRTNVAKILDATGTSITTKGKVYEKGETPGPADLPPLYVLVEGDTKVVVDTAVDQLTVLLKEGYIAAQEEEARMGTRGRYSVV